MRQHNKEKNYARQSGDQPRKKDVKKEEKKAEERKQKRQLVTIDSTLILHTHTLRRDDMLTASLFLLRLHRAARLSFRVDISSTKPFELSAVPSASQVS